MVTVLLLLKNMPVHPTRSQGLKVLAWRVTAACPGGDLSLVMWEPDAQDPLSVCRPVGVENYRLDDAQLDGWSQPERAAYKGLHGLHIARADWEK